MLEPHHPLGGVQAHRRGAEQHVHAEIVDELTAGAERDDLPGDDSGIQMVLGQWGRSYGLIVSVPASRFGLPTLPLERTRRRAVQQGHRRRRAAIHP
ncbi:hypothetical protein ABT304_02755 [Nocardioides sp. NPDC000445]|uniref:hypothetical protein n=1 Tax=Nocardioides sp. NPDC000445 TaxID=3154257 RepID=UPI0033176727